MCRHEGEWLIPPRCDLLSSVLVFLPWGGLEGGADTRACGHVVLRQNAVLWFHEARFGRCFTERKESLARRAEDALMCEDAVTLKSTLSANEKVVSTTGWKQNL